MLNPAQTSATNAFGVAQSPKTMWRTGILCPRMPAFATGNLSALCRRQRPANPLPGAVAVKANQALFLVAVQAFDGVVQAAFGFQLIVRRQRVVKMLRPAFFFEGCEDQLLIDG